MSYEIKVWNGGNPSYNCRARTETPKYIAVHYTADGKPDSHTAYNSMLYFSRANRNASAHFFIDNYDIYEFADPARWSCWHVGDGNGAYGITNQNSIGIEVVQDGNAPFSTEEIRKLTWLVQKLMKQFGIPASRVVRHYDASRKLCPWYYTPGGAGGDAAWNALHKTITTQETSQVPGNPINSYGLKYQAHVQDIGWCDVVRDGQTAGTTGKGLRLEAIRFTSIPAGWKIRAKAHVQDEGWVTYDVSEGTVIGTTGKSRRIECLILEAPTKPSGKRLKFQVHQQDKGWKGWTYDGFASGTDGMGLRLEAVRIAIE